MEADFLNMLRNQKIHIITLNKLFFPVISIDINLLIVYILNKLYALVLIRSQH